MNATGYFTHKDCRLHEMGPGHPECPERLDAIEDRLLITGVGDALQRREAPLAPLADIELAHGRMMVAALRGLREALGHLRYNGGEQNALGAEIWSGLGATFQAAELKSPVSYPLKGAYSVRDFARSARFEGLPYALPEVFPIPTQNAARIFWWLSETRGEEAAADWARAGLRAVFVHGVVLNDPAALRAVAVENGIAPDEAEAVWNDPAWKARLKRENDEAIAAGIFGAPFFVVDGEPFWGNDRKPHIERWLGSGPF